MSLRSTIGTSLWVLFYVGSVGVQGIERNENDDLGVQVTSLPIRNNLVLDPPHLEMALTRFRSQNHQLNKQYETSWHELLTWTESVLERT